MSIEVSIICITYNHGKYIRECLDGFVRQQTDFDFEVIVHDDASTDNTPDIVREYAERYPHLLVPIFQQENQYSQKKPFIRDYILPKLHGLYVAFCEGDDYWVDPLKLQKQYDVLKENPACGMCLAKVKMISEDGQVSKGFLPSSTVLNSGIVSSDFFIRSMLSLGLYVHTSTYFIRKALLEEHYLNPPDFIRLMNGDMGILYNIAYNADVYYIDDIVGCYRVGVPGGWMMRNKQKNVPQKIAQLDQEIESIKEYDKFTKLKYHELCVFNVTRFEFNILMLKRKFFHVLSPRFKKMRENWSLKQYFILFLQFYMPDVMTKLLNAYKKIKRKAI